MNYKLGKLPAKKSPKTYKMDLLLDKTNDIIIPEEQNWAIGWEWPMWGNDKIGCCTQVSVASAIKVWTVNTKKSIILSDNDVIKNYSDESGYNPNDPSTDKGAVELDVLTRWNKIGYTWAAGINKLYAFGSVDKNNIENIKKTIYLFGGCYIGVELPSYAMEAVQNNQGYWDLEYYDDNIIGGHAVFLHGYDSKYFYFNTWGENWKMSFDFFENYCEESYALISTDWLDGISHLNPLKNNIVDMINQLKNIS